MSRKRLTAWVLVVAVGMAARITIAAPRNAVAELRAIVCCMEHCPDGRRPPMTPHRCCFVGSDATDPASTTTVSSLERPDAPALAVTIPAVSIEAPVRIVARLDLASLRAGPPGFLLTQKLRC